MSSLRRSRTGSALASLGVLTLALAMGLSGRSYAAGVEWGYSGNTGPEHLGKDFSVCGMGRNQSPVDIAEQRVLDISALVSEEQTVGSRPAGFLKIEPDYQDVPLRIINNGHAVEVRYDAGSKMTVHGRARELKQFHFHTPSENHIAGESFPMEVHLVHSDENNSLTVITVLFKKGAANPLLETLRTQLPERVGKEVTVADQAINVKDLLPKDTRYYYFNGSLTTPPCSEGVAWLVLKEPMEASKEQLDAFRSTMGFDNNRPVQPLNTRVVLGW